MNYAKRRQQVLETMPPYSVALVCSGSAPYSVGDEKYPFAVNRNFYYLTGIERENMILALVKLPKGSMVYLFIERFDEWMAKWVGAKMLPEEATRISGISPISYMDEFTETVGGWLNRFHNEDVIVYSDFTKQAYSQTNSYMEDFTYELQKKYPWVSIKNIESKIASLRMVKDEEEIENLRKGIEVTDRGIQSMMRHVKEGINESEIYAHFQFELMKVRCKNSFPSIVASGKNATVLHYGENNCVIQPNTMVLVDLGAAYQMYNADISRTFPASGTFTARQKEIYEIVLACNKHIIEYAKCGMTLRELNDEVIRFYEETLKPTGLLEKGRVRDYYFHGVSHMLGLETHDVNVLDTPLEPGNVFTVEPGLYIEAEQIGVRIEDDVVMREDGVEVLSKNIIKEVADIEAFMQGYRHA